MSPCQGDRRNGDDQAGGKRELRVHAEREEQEDDDHAGASPDRVAEHHGPSVLCPVSAEQILSARGAALVHLESPLEQGPDEAGGTDMTERDAKE